MNRILPAPLVSLALLVAWIGLQRDSSIGTVALGAILAIVVPFAVRRFLLASRPRRPIAVARYMAIVAFDVVASNLAVARDVVAWARRRPAARFVVIPLELRDPNGLAVLAMVTTVVPGTVWSELAIDRSAMLLHVWHVEDEHEFVARFKARYEQPLREIFE